MKSFFSTATQSRDVHAAGLAATGIVSGDAPRMFGARIAVYDSAAAAPRIVDVEAPSPDGLIEQLAASAHALAGDQGGALPYTVVREVVENLIHAEFREIVVSILDDGDTMRFADQGPGILDKGRAVLPGFSTATSVMKQYIRGVGSGLPIVNEFISLKGGRFSIDDNLGTGTVVTLTVAPEEGPPEAPREDSEEKTFDLSGVPRLTTRQKKVLSLVLEFGEAGPTLVHKELSVGLSTAYRDLAYLEDGGLIAADESGKRILTDLGSFYLENLFT